jgi:tetratricopeptide (TPR) repeat protein
VRDDDSGKRPLLLAAVAFAAGALLYAGTTGHAYVYDDIQIVRDNPLVTGDAPLGKIFTSHYWAGYRDDGNLYRPATMLSFRLVRSMAGPGPAGQHALNILLHGAVSTLVVLLAFRLGLCGAGSLAAGLLFATHPVHVEAVAPVVGRSELLAALFGLAAWLSYLRATREGSGISFGRAWLIGAAVAPLLFGCALLSKEGIAVLPALILCAELVAGGGGGAWRRRALPMALLWGLLLVWLAARGILLASSAGGDGGAGAEGFGGVSTAIRLLSAVAILGRYLVLTLFPAWLSADYSFNQIPLVTGPADGAFLASMASCLALAVAGILLARRGRLSGLGILIYLGAIFPLSNLAFPIGTVMGERLLYLPSLGWCLFLPALAAEWTARRGSRGGAESSAPLPAGGGTGGGGGEREINRRLPAGAPSSLSGRLATAGILAVVALYAGRSLVRIPEWKDPLALFRATVRRSPMAARAWLNLGVAEEAAGGRDAALAAYRRAVAIKPDQPDARHRLGRALLERGDSAGAAVELEAALRAAPVPSGAWLDLGRAFHGLGRRADALHAFRMELVGDAGSWSAEFNLGQLLVEQGAVSEGLEHILRAAALKPGEAMVHLQAARVLALLGRRPEAVDAWDRALTLKPDLDEALLPAARAALAAGETERARRWATEARRKGLPLPPELEPLAR